MMAVAVFAAAVAFVTLLCTICTATSDSPFFVLSHQKAGFNAKSGSTQLLFFGFGIGAEHTKCADVTVEMQCHDWHPMLPFVINLCPRTIRIAELQQRIGYIDNLQNVTCKLSLSEWTHYNATYRFEETLSSHSLEERPRPPPPPLVPSRSELLFGVLSTPLIGALSLLGLLRIVLRAVADHGIERLRNEQRRQQRREDAQRLNPAIDPQHDVIAPDDAVDGICPICMVCRQLVVLDPCGHGLCCGCFLLVHEAERPACAMCMREIVRGIRMY